ncbi:MAG TPA: hypothetical protein VGK94_10265 [Candidatus Polarisedimenticolia bacterium]|jgi:hypothetical protein
MNLFVLLAAILLSASRTSPQEGAAAPAEPPLSAGEEIALARLRELHEIGKAFNSLTWPEFDPAGVPAVLYKPGGWAIAVGFADPPAGFHLLAGMLDGERPVYRAAPGAFRPGTGSPDLVAGQWTVISRFEPPQPLLTGDYLGRATAEEEMARFIGDAFSLYLMKQRGRERPFVIGPSAYPESAEMIATTYLERRIVLRAAQMTGVNEKNIDRLHNLVRQIIAVRRKRAAMLGSELATLESEVENWDGMRLYTMTLLYRHALSGAFAPAGLGKVDPTFDRYQEALLERLLITNRPMAYSPDNPATTPPQVASKTASLLFLLDRLSGDWREKALPGHRSFTDLLAEAVPLPEADEAATLESAKSENRYDQALRLAGEDLADLLPAREKILAAYFPEGPDRLDIKLSGRQATSYRDDPERVGYLGGGLLLHLGGLTLTAPGLELKAPGPPEGSPPPILTRAGPRRDALSLMRLMARGGTLSLQGGRLRRKGPAVRLSAERCLDFTAPGIELRLCSGTLEVRPDGSLEVALPQTDAPVERNVGRGGYIQSEQRNLEGRQARDGKQPGRQAHSAGDLGPAR